MKVPKDMRKQFEAEYPANANVRACEWCHIWHQYRARPEIGMSSKKQMDLVEHRANALFERYINARCIEAFDAVYRLDAFTVRAAAATEFSTGYVEQMESIYDEEVSA